MDYHGRRFLTVQQFISRARDLKLRWLDERELEFYERHCLMLPTARTTEPSAMARAIAQRAHQLEVTSPADLEPPIDWTRLEDDAVDGQHPFDREIGTNPFIDKPQCETYVPWHERDIEITPASGDSVRIPTVERYYDYWQVHVVEQLRALQVQERATVASELQVGSSLRAWYTLPEDTTPLRRLRGMDAGYDALTRFSDMHRRVIEHAYHGVTRGQELPPAAIASVRESLERHTSRIVVVTGLDESTFLQFVVEAIHLMDHYIDHERASLAADVRRDLEIAYRFAHYAWGRDWDAFVEGVQRIGGYWSARTVRHLDPVEVARDEAKQNLGYILKGDVGIALDAGTLERLPEEWTEFCIRNELFEALKGVESYSFTEREFTTDSYPWFRYRRLRPLALAVEHLARGILEVAQRLQSGDTLSGLFQTIGKGTSWEPLFKTLYERRDRNASFEQQVKNLMATARPGDPEDVVIGRTLALATIARNVGGHQHRELPEHTVQLLIAACSRALVITWVVARRAGLV